MEQSEESLADNSAQLDQFLASVEKRALVMAEMATHERQEALDIVQESMIAFCKKYAQRSAVEWPPIFHRILQNKIRDWHRRHKVRSRWRVWLGGNPKETEEHDAIQQLADPANPQPERHHASDQASEALIAAVQTLPHRQQQAFLLRTWEGLGVEETAQAMGCSGGSVKTHLSRAMQALRIQLEDYRP